MTRFPPRLRALRVVLAAGALLSSSCSEPKSGGGTNGIAFTDPDSDVIAVLPAALAGDPTIVVMPGESAEHAKYVELVYGDGTWIEAVADDSGHLVELNLTDQRFVLSDHSATQFTVTHYAPDGTVSSEQVAIGPKGEMAVAMPAALLTEDSAEQDPVERATADALTFFQDPSNYQRDWFYLKKAGQWLETSWDKAQKKVDGWVDGGEKLGTKLGNQLTCLTETRRQCAEQVAAQAPELVRELHQMDPSGQTEAGFEVRDTGISPKQDEWALERTRGTIPTEFTLTDVPCEESVFADMNPDCPQYVPPTPTMSNGGTGSIGASGAGGMGGAGGKGGAGGTGGTGGGPAVSGCRANSQDDNTYFVYSYECDEYSEHYRNAAADGSTYERLSRQNAGLGDKVTFAMDPGGTLLGYAAEDYAYDAEGMRVLREFISISPSNKRSERLVWTAINADEETRESVECNDVRVHHQVILDKRNPTSIGQGKLLSSTDDNDTSKCPTIDDVKALGKKVFPEVDMSLEYLKTTVVYMNYTAAH